MNKQATRLGWIAPFVLALAVLACSSQPEATATPLPRPTQKPNATATTEPATAKPAATKAPATRVPAKATATQASAQPTEVPTEASTGNAPFTLSSTPYVHKTGAFTVTLPEGWAPQEGNNSVYAESPDKVSSIDITFTNVGAQFDAATLEKLIRAEEDNWFAKNNNYQAKAEEPQKDGSILIFKTFELTDGTPETAFSYYWEAGTIVYEQDFWVDSASYDAYAAGLVNVANTMTTNPDAVTQADAYAVVYTFSPNNLYQFNIPYAWPHTSGITDKTDAETFTSPDQLSTIENDQYDNGTTYTQAAADAFAVSLLKQNYKLTDLKITDKQQQADGSYLLAWTSASKGIEGESDYQARNTTFLLLTWEVDSKHYDFFKPVWSTVLGSYSIPQP